MGFSLVPWKPVIEQRLGQRLAATVRGGGVSWEMDGGLGCPEVSQADANDSTERIQRNLLPLNWGHQPRSKAQTRVAFGRRLAAVR
jgi:hypothetical protein